MGWTFLGHTKGLDTPRGLDILGGWTYQRTAYIKELDMLKELDILWDWTYFGAGHVKGLTGHTQGLGILQDWTD